MLHDWIIGVLVVVNEMVLRNSSVVLILPVRCRHRLHNQLVQSHRSKWVVLLAVGIHRLLAVVHHHQLNLHHCSERVAGNESATWLNDMTHVALALQAVALPAKRVVSLSCLLVSKCSQWIPCLVAITAVVTVVVIIRFDVPKIACCVVCLLLLVLWCCLCLCIIGFNSCGVDSWNKASSWALLLQIMIVLLIQVSLSMHGNSRLNPLVVIIVAPRLQKLHDMLTKPRTSHYGNSSFLKQKPMVIIG